MAIANLLQSLSSNQSGLKECIFYGKLRCFIQPPHFLSRLKTDGTGQYAIFDTFAVKCVGTDWFYSHNNGAVHSMYYTKGSILIYTNKADLIGEYCKVGGRTLSRGLTVKQQRGCGATSGITGFVFTKDGSDWVVLQNQLVKIGETESALRSPDMMDFVMKNIISNSESMEFPESMGSVLEYSATPSYNEISAEVVVQNVPKFNKSTGEKIDISKIDLKLTYHMSGIEKPEFYYAVEDEIEHQAAARNKYAKELFSEALKNHENISEDVYDIANDIKKSFVNNIICNLAENVGKSKVKGRFYLDQLLNTLTMPEIGGDSSADGSQAMSDSRIAEIKNSIIENPDYLYSSEAPSRLYDPIKFAIIVIGISTGIEYGGLNRNYKSMSRVGKISVEEWFSLLLSNPYMLSMMGSSISVVDADVIYYSYCKFYSKELIMHSEHGVEKMRGDLLYLKALEGCCDKDSMISKNVLINYERSSQYAGNNLLKKNGFPLNAQLVALLSVLMGSNIALSGNEIKALIQGKWYTAQRTVSLTERGLIDDVGEKLMLGKDLEKEFLIFKVFQEKGLQLTGISDEECDSVIDEYEADMGFKLEPLQRDGIHLVKYKAALLSGCAGSGKTTTSACMTRCLEKYLDGYKLIYCTPTGKASRRLAEVVGGTVKTCHSQFKIGVGIGESYLMRVRRKYNSERDGGSNAKAKIYIIDEAGMLNRDVLFEIATSIQEEDLVFFLGDIKQLPPIGVGVPFYLLMQILPCVELGVNKRAAEGSLINYNTTLINCLSDGVIEELMFDDSSFICTECSDEDIQRQTVKSFLDWMSGAKDGKPHKEEEIQVITGYTSEKYNFSSTCLNPMLQAKLRAKDKRLFGHGTKEFYKNDRVIHVNSNIYGMPRYIKTGHNSFEEVATLGVINGEMGILEGVVNSESITIEEFSEDNVTAGVGHYDSISEEALKDILETREDYADRLINMNDYVDGEMYFVLMRVYDVDLKKDVYIFYYGRVSRTDEGMYLTGSSLDNLDLAYALTCHKMQGSQTPIAVIPMGSSCNPSFINRNMLNTMITRSQESVELIGTVQGQDSPLNKGRMEVSKRETECLLQVLCNEARKTEGNE